MKKIWIIVLVTVGVLGALGAAAYFFWDDLGLLFGEQPKVAEGPAGGVSLVADFEKSQKGPSPDAPASEPAPSSSDADAPGGSVDDEVEVGEPTTEASTAPDAPAPKSGGDGMDEEGLDLGDDEEATAPAPAKPATAPAKPATAAAKKEPPPTLTRKPDPAPAKPAPAKPAPKKKPAPPPEEIDEDMEGEPPPPKRTGAAPKPKPAPAPADPAVEASTAVQKKVQELMKRKRFAEAEVAMRQHLIAHPLDGDVQFLMGFLMIQQNRRPQALAHFQSASKNAKTPHIRKMAEQYLQKLR